MNSPRNGAVALTIDVGRVETGLWCPTCLLPSGYSANLAHIGPSGVSTIGVLRRCDTGDHPLPEAAS